MFRLRPTIFKTMLNSPTESAAIINIVMIEIATTFCERFNFNSIPVRPFNASALWTDRDP